MSVVDNWVVVGRFGKVHGIKGLILVHSFTMPSENILDYLPWHIKVKKQWCPIKATPCSMRHDDKILVQVENYLTREEVACLTNLDIAVPRDILPELDKNDFYLHDLIGLNVFDEQGKHLGDIEDIMSTGEQDVVVISGKTRILVPFVWDVFVKSVDLDNKSMMIHWDDK